MLCNGKYKIPVKNGAPAECKDTTIIVISNVQNFEEIYTNHDCSPLWERFNYVNFEERKWRKFPKKY